MLTSKMPRPRHSRIPSPRRRRFAALAGDLSGDGFSKIVELINELLAVAIGSNARLPDDITPEGLPDALQLLTAGLGGSGSEAALSSRLSGPRTVRQFRGGRGSVGPTSRDFQAQFELAGYSPEQSNRMANRL